MPFSLTRLRSSPPYGSIPSLLLSHRSTPATLSGPLDPKKARDSQSLFTDIPPLRPPVQRAFCHRAQQGAVALCPARSETAAGRDRPPSAVLLSGTSQGVPDRQCTGCTPSWDGILFLARCHGESMMATINHPTVQRALERLRNISADDDARRLAWVCAPAQGTGRAGPGHARKRERSVRRKSPR